MMVVNYNNIKREDYNLHFLYIDTTDTNINYHIDFATLPLEPLDSPNSENKNVSTM